MYHRIDDESCSLIVAVEGTIHCLPSFLIFPSSSFQRCSISEKFYSLCCFSISNISLAWHNWLHESSVWLPPTCSKRIKVINEPLGFLPNFRPLIPPVPNIYQSLSSVEDMFAMMIPEISTTPYSVSLFESEPNRVLQFYICQTKFYYPPMTMSFLVTRTPTCDVIPVARPS